MGNLDVASTWKKIQETVEKDVAMKKLSISVARCYSTKNRSPDVLPFDQSRVALLNTKVIIIDTALKYIKVAKEE